MTVRKHVDSGTSCLCRLPLLEISIEEVVQEIEDTRSDSQENPPVGSAFLGEIELAELADGYHCVE